MALATNISELHSSAVNQIDKEFSELETFLKNEAKPDEVRIVNAALNLRRLYGWTRMTKFNDLVFGLDGRGSKYSCLYAISDTGRSSTIARDLLDLVSQLSYDILDYGYLRLVRVKMNYQTFKAGEEVYHVRYFLTRDENLTMKKIEEAVKDHSPLPFRIVNVKKMRFSGLGQFASFLELLVDGFDSSTYQDGLARRIDDLMKPETYEDQEENAQ